MSRDLENFRRILRAVLQDPARADKLVEAIADVALSGEEALQRAVADELARAIAQASAAPAPFGRKLSGQTRIDILMLSPGGVILKGRYYGKALLSELLGCAIDENRVLGVLGDDVFGRHFGRVRDGQEKTVWFDFEHGQAGFAAVHPDLGDAPLEKPDCIFAFFVTTDRPDETRRDPKPNVAPIGLGKLIRQISPATAKSPRDWLRATPDRKIVRLRDGRAMSTRWYGAASAKPVLAFGPIHKSTTADAFLANAAIAHGLAMLVIERPGLGASDAAPVTSYELVADDVAQIVRAFDLPAVSIYGAGMAASFALATARRLGPSATAIALASPRVGRPSSQADSPYGRVLWALLKNPFGLEVSARLLRQLRIAGSVHSLLLSFAVNNSRDRTILKEQGMLDYFAAQTNDAVHKTVEGALAEFKLYQSGAFCDPALVRQPIRIWQGAEDRTLLLEDTIRAFAGAPNAQVEVTPGAGVLMDPDEASAIMGWLADGWKRQSAGGSKSAD
jgi:pimeloyl-ACP methyl ester carboxylesterase